MARALLVLANDAIRQKAVRWIMGAKPNSRVLFQGPKRTLPQNDRMWAMLTDIATQKPWHGDTLTPDDWKLIFLDALKEEVRVVPSLDGTGLVAIDGRSSSDLSIEEMSDMIELMFAWGSANGVTFHDTPSPSAVLPPMGGQGAGPSQSDPGDGPATLTRSAA